MKTAVFKFPLPHFYFDDFSSAHTVAVKLLGKERVVEASHQYHYDFEVKATEKELSQLVTNLIQLFGHLKARHATVRYF